MHDFELDRLALRQTRDRHPVASAHMQCHLGKVLNEKDMRDSFVSFKGSQDRRGHRELHSHNLVRQKVKTEQIK
jgi:hypothetical protein